MQPLVKQTISLIEQATSLAELASAMQPFIEASGFAWYVVNLAEEFGIKADAVIGLSNMPEDILAGFTKVDFFLIDPLLILARRTNAPFIWSEKVNVRFVEPEVRKIYDRWGEWGIGDGITVPVWRQDARGSVLFTTMGAPLPPTDLDALALVGYALHERVDLMFDPLSIASRYPDLTEIEIELLRLASEGLSSQDIDARTNLNKRQVDHHFTNAVTKMGAESRIHAIIRAYRMDFFSPFTAGGMRWRR